MRAETSFGALRLPKQSCSNVNEFETAVIRSASTAWHTSLMENSSLLT